jgi:nucleoside-diphosphate-sugar epimerase
MEKIIVTGYSGFVGRNLTKTLGQEFQITGAGRTAEKDTLLLDTLQPSSLDGTTAFIHLAGKAHDIKNTSAADEYFKVNTQLTQKLFDIFLQSTARDFIYFSSVKAAADTVDGILDESVVPAPKTPYGLSKQKAEEYLLSQPLPAGKRLIILRPCMIHGPGNKGNLNLLYGFIKRGIPYPLAAFDNKRSFLSIDNLLYVIKTIINNKDIPSGIYNVADDDVLSTNQLVKLIAGVMNRSAKTWHIPKGLLTVLAKIGDIGRLPLNTHRLQKLTENYLVSNKKLKSALHIDRLPVSVEEGLINTIRSFS